MANIEQIIADIKELKLLEVAELVKKMEEEFGVSAAAPVAVMAGGGAGGGGRWGNIRRNSQRSRRC